MFCDYCDCSDCQYGGLDIDCYHGINWHARTDRNNWICNICYNYNVCTSGPNRSENGPCKNKECQHRPKLITDWISFHE